MDSAAADGSFAYDEVEYPIVASSQLTPDRIRANGLVRGWSAPDPRTASFLEIGCGMGLNPIGIAAVFPDSRCAGFDLSANAIAKGRRLAAAAGIGNVTLEHADILDYPRDGEKFDYVVTHGVLAWVPPHVGDALLELIAARLAPGGVAYVGYDCLPTAGVKQAINRFLVEQTAHIADAADRVDRAIEIAAIINATQHQWSRFKTVLQHLVEDAPTYTRSYVYHDWLAEHYHPRALREVAGICARHGLRFAGDAMLGDTYVGDLNDPARDLVARTGDDLVARSDMLDLMRGGHSFHTDLFVRTDAPPPPVDNALRSLGYTLQARREEVEVDGEPAIRYRRDNVGIICSDADMRTVLDCLIAHAPNELDFAALVAASGLAPEALDRVLAMPNFQQMAIRHATPQPFTTTPGDRPRAGRLIRAMMTEESVGVSLRHSRFEVKEDPTRLLLALANGERTRAEIAALIAEALEVPATVEMVDGAIGTLSTRAIFEA